MEYDADSEGAVCKLCKTFGKALEPTGGVWTTRPFTSWKKATEQIKAHAQSEWHIRAKQAVSAYQASQQAGSVIQHLQDVADQDQMKNRAAVKCFLCCAHFLAHQQNPHTTNFEKLVGLVVQCGW